MVYNMMTLEQLLLTKLVEEMTEVNKLLIKAQQWGFDDHHPKHKITNRERIHKELDDVMASIDMLNAVGLEYEPSMMMSHHKKEKVKHYLKMQIERGFVEEKAWSDLLEAGL